jgi:hypothetical protein
MNTHPNSKLRATVALIAVLGVLGVSRDSEARSAKPLGIPILVVHELFEWPRHSELERLFLAVYPDNRVAYYEEGASNHLRDRYREVRYSPAGAAALLARFEKLRSVGPTAAPTPTTIPGVGVSTTTNAAPFTPAPANCPADVFPSLAPVLDAQHWAATIDCSREHASFLTLWDIIATVNNNTAPGRIATKSGSAVFAEYEVAASPFDPTLKGQPTTVVMPWRGPKLNIDANGEGCTVITSAVWAEAASPHEPYRVWKTQGRTVELRVFPRTRTSATCANPFVVGTLPPPTSTP